MKCSYCFVTVSLSIIDILYITQCIITDKVGINRHEKIDIYYNQFLTVHSQLQWYHRL